MDKNSISRWLLIAVLTVGMFFLFDKGCGKKESAHFVPEQTFVDAPDFAPDALPPPEGSGAGTPPDETLCVIRGPRFEAELSTRGAAIKHVHLLDKRYAESAAEDVGTTPDHERWRSLRTSFRGPGADDQLPYDRFVWKLDDAPKGACVFVYESAEVRIRKVIENRGKPFELSVATTVTNLSDTPRRHQFSTGLFAYRKNAELKGSLGRVPPFQTELSCAKQKTVERIAGDDSKFKEGWFSVPGSDRYAAISNYYFAEAMVPKSGDTPDCRLLSEARFWPGQAPDDDNAGRLFQAKLEYAPRSLGPNEAASYELTAFFGPKEREVLASAAGERGLGDLLNLGFFTPVAKILVSILVFISRHITFGNWGIAIILMTIGIRCLLFPLMWKQIKTGIAMRKLKPEIDKLGAKFKDDLQAKNVAMMELYRKHKVNPLGGCVPQLATMPVWFAMYTTLQTAVEFYNTRFLWFSDLSAPDKYYLMPLVLGGTMILQQRLVPAQGMDPMQQKMMTWLLPIVFTVMMLFLPAALGIYMLTNSCLGILQQLAVEKFAPRGGDNKKGEESLPNDVEKRAKVLEA